VSGPQLTERPRCPVCGADPESTLYRCSFGRAPIRDYLIRFYPSFSEEDLELLSEGEYQLETCSKCTLIWQRWAPNEPLLTRLYEDWAAGDGDLTRQDTIAYHRAAAEEILLVLELAGKRPSEVDVLDFGAGWGRWPRLAAGLGCNAVAVEIGEHQVGYARAHGVEVRTLDELPDATFEFVNAEQVFEHLVQPRETLVRLARALAPGGWLKINVPSDRNIRARLRNPDWDAPKGAASSLNAVAPLEHLNCFSAKALDQRGSQAGLRRESPRPRAYYASTIGLWPPRRLLRGLSRPPIRRVRPSAAFFRHA